MAAWRRAMHAYGRIRNRWRSHSEFGAPRRDKLAINFAMQCRRVPPFPFQPDGALLAEVKSALGTDGKLDPADLDALFCASASLRRQIHAHPEPGFEEKGTQALIRELLISFVGIPASAIRSCAGTGLVADILGKGTGKSTEGRRVIALRADMDALRMTEGNNGLPYRSSNEGVAHLCGHDGHMASLIATAALLNRRAHLLPSDCAIRLLFQPAEEGPGGAKPMVDDKCMEGVDEVYGYHNWPSFPLGQLHVKAGAVMAHPTKFEIVVEGKGGHGSQPHVAVDPVLVSAHIVVALQSVVSRAVPSKDQAVLSCTMIHGGEVNNVIPDSVTICGTIRDLSPTVYTTITDRLKAIVAGQAASWGAKATVHLHPAYPCVENHAEQTEAVIAVGQKYVRVVSDEGLPMMGAEDFSYFLHEKPGCFFFIGGSEATLRGWSQLGAPGQRSNCMCHNTAFDFNDNIIPIASILFIRIVESRLGISLYSDDELPIPLPTDEDVCDNPDGISESGPLPEAGAPTPQPTGPIVLKSKRPRKE